jgi:UDP-N-acetylglucosamine:LPS N-acetylglucosamine transferase
LGTNSLTNLLPVIMSLKTRCGFIINTGTDKAAYNLVELVIKTLKNSRKRDLIIVKNMGWIEHMAEILSACDIVFGKAGPNFIFDVVAAKKPFVAITHMGGQEDGNIDLIEKKKIGWVKEKHSEITEFLYEYLQTPKIFEEMYLENIERERQKNIRSLPVILEKVISELQLDSGEYASAD